MKDIKTLFAEAGIAIPEENAETFEKAFHENYKTIAEVNKINAKMDALKDRAETAEKAIESFGGMTPEQMQGEIAKYKKQAEDLQAEYEGKMAEREYSELLDKEFANYKFSSAAAKSAIYSRVKEKKLSVENGKLLGFADMMDALKAEDESAFVTEGEKAPRFTMKTPKGSGLTKEQIMDMKDAEERQKAIQENLHLFE